MAALASLYYLHNKLGRSTQHISRSGTLASFSISDRVDTVPESVFSTGQFFSLYDRAWRAVPKGTLPEVDDLPSELGSESDTADNPDQSDDQNLKCGRLLTLYLRHTMTQFSRVLPQAWILWLMSPAGSLHRRSFQPAYIQRLDFREGDVVCGMYVVKLRTTNKVEFDIRPPTSTSRPTNSSGAGDDSKTGRSGMNARLVISIQEGKGDEDADKYIFSSDTIMWKAADDDGVVLPLEKAPVKWMHELAAWGLLDSGVRYLQGLKRLSRKKL